MARALPAGRTPHKRHLFGAVDGDGWAWASIKAFFWLLVIIMTLGYIPDRAYYFIVSRTIDLGIVGWAPVNLCPPENTASMPCPVPAGAILPWQPSPSQAALPAARFGGNALQLGPNLLYAGGSDANGATTTTYTTKIDKGNFGPWAEGPALPEARTGAGVTTLNGVGYMVGGTGPDGTPTKTVWTIGLDPDTSALRTWTTVCTVALKATETCAADKVLSLPDARTGAAVLAVSDGFLVIGGAGGDGKPTATVWKSTLDNNGVLGAFTEQPGLPHAVTDAAVGLEGTYVFVYGGTGDSGPVGGVMRSSYGAVPSPIASGASATPAASGSTPPQGIVQWATLDSANMPVARTGGAGFSANGAMYYVGGSDGTQTHGDVYWALPDASGNLPGGWRHLAAMDLPGGLVNASPIVAGTNVILIGGKADGGPLTSSTRASLAPQEPFFRLGLVGVTVPGLQISGEIGQQLGYLAAAGVGTGNFVILVIIGWAFNHRPQIAAWWQRRKLEREAKVPQPEEA
jgi:N-acetylneuraminic acid mutarotase